MQPTKVELARLPLNEVDVLRDIAKELGKKDWNFGIDPCINESSWLTPISKDRPWYNNSVICNCSCTNQLDVNCCHVTEISLKGQDLDGMLPRSIMKLPYLNRLDLTRNYLSGNIPPEWVYTTSLRYLSLTVNRLTGPLPEFLGNITQLVYLNVENNLFNGTVPPELGNLPNLANLILNANNFSGELPMALSNLTKLAEFRISSNNFSGKIPSLFIQRWKQLEKLAIQGSGLQGPIPSNISFSTNLTELRISDLQGEGSDFPDLKNSKRIKTLVLRNCNISGPIPYYLPQMPSLKYIDVSFNRLSGDLSKEFIALQQLENMYFTNNQLTGNIPNWIKDESTRPPKIDLSYNSFTRSPTPICGDTTLNLFKSSFGSNNTMTVECLIPCTKDKTFVHINCGGGQTTVGKTVYDEDIEPGGASYYVPRKNTWVVSTTGHWDIDNDTKPHYTVQNTTALSRKDSNLYTTARLSPLSLTYYVPCLRNGNYSVTLHFAEIIIRGNQSFFSLGRRIFDVYIQGILVLKDFEIKKEAKGVDKSFIKEFKKIKVNDKSLEINLRWTGKGTTVSPVKGTYGPLISAIDVRSEFNERVKKILTVVGAVVFPLFISFIIASIVYWKCYSVGRRTKLDQELAGLDFQTAMFTYRQIRVATDNFNTQNKIGEGGFGAVYKGILADGTEVAVKQLSSKSKQGNREFVNEIGLISASQHPNLVKLFGCCVEGSQLLLVYEYMENNSLAYNLFGERDGHTTVLNWPTRHKICIGIARGLAFLHEESAIKIVHRDIKATNVLLDKDLNAKISDFGLAKLDHEENTHISTRVAGTIGYMAPEYALWGHLTYKADVYSFGVVALEIVAGKSNMKRIPDKNSICLVDLALVLKQEKNVMELVDPRLESDFNEEEVSRVIEIASLCTNPSAALRPTMSTVISMLEGKVEIYEQEMDTSFSGNEFRSTTIKRQYDQMLMQNISSETRSVAHSSDAIWAASSSTSGHQDLYPFNTHSTLA
ncbi:Leucine-rich repeat transmembrane protein kinase [Euphorbia peplus]|nr:Leucine-rich repeat transmembrane protein kinase [Euphorbia peplus]